MIEVCIVETARRAVFYYCKYQILEKNWKFKNFHYKPLPSWRQVYRSVRSCYDTYDELIGPLFPTSMFGLLMRVTRRVADSLTMR